MLPNRLDFWNDPERWDGIADPHKELFWMKRHVDRIDVRRPTPNPVENPYLNYQMSLAQLVAYQQASAGLLNSYGHIRQAHGLGSIFGGLLG